MPELAEVEFFRKRWHLAGAGQRVRRVQVRAAARVFRDTDPTRLPAVLEGARLVESAAAAKQMLFHFSAPAWLGVHLGMSGELSVADPAYSPARHDHLVLVLEQVALVFTDPRMFGSIRLSTEAAPPDWWTGIAPAILSSAFTRQRVHEFLERRGRAPIKAVLLMQECFPGIGNWMADEILWRAAIHPAQPAASLGPAERDRLWLETRRVCRLALRAIAGEGEDLPPDLNVNIPDTWLFNHRWKDGGRCPRTGATLARAEIGGRTSCWSPARQVLHRPRPRAPRAGR